MKRLNNIGHLFLFGILLGLGACDLVELDTPGPTEQVEAPVGLPETLEAFNLALSGEESRTWNALTFTLEGLRGFQFCRLDDSFQFFANGTYRYDGGNVLCGGEDAEQIRTGTWEVDFANAQILFDKETGREYRAQVSGINDDRIQLFGEVVIFGDSRDIDGIYQIASN